MRIALKTAPVALAACLTGVFVGDGMTATAHAERMSENRAKARDLVIPDVVDPARRAEAEANDCLWLQTYCPDVFYSPFTPHQERIIADCGEVLRYGTQKCKAAPRGDGKTSIVKYLALKYALCRQVRFPLIVAATGEKSKDSLDSLKFRMAGGARLDRRNRTFELVTAIGQDYPLECCVASYVNPWPSRARNATANDQRVIHVEWGSNCIIIPTWEDEEPLGPILLSLGITSDELQGCNVYDQRPDFVMLDDLDSRDSLASADGVVAAKIEQVVDKTIAGLGGQSRRLGQFMLCTITSRKSAAYKYSDPELKPAWSGERVAAIIKWPTNKHLWDEYIDLRKWGQATLGDDGRPVDVFGRKAHELYESKFAEMNEGAVLSNPHNYQTDLLPDGSATHLSALQKCYDYIADKGIDSFLTEHQNDPPESAGPIESGITPQIIQKSVSGLPKGEIPEGCTVLVHGMDVGKYRIHWVVRAFKPDATGYTIDYGFKVVLGSKYGTDEGLDKAIYAAVLARIAEFRDMPYAQQFRDSLTLVDAGYRTEAVYAACKEAGLGVKPVMGFGKSAGCAKISWAEVSKRTEEKRPICDGAFESRKDRNFWLVCANADKWKAWEHDRWMTAADKPGRMFLWGNASEDPKRFSEDERNHGAYAEMICAEVEVEDIVKGALARVWKSKQTENHWLDASYYADVAAAIKGIRIAGEASIVRPPPSERPSIKEMMGRGR